jgi:hypothetical protein
LKKKKIFPKMSSPALHSGVVTIATFAELLRFKKATSHSAVCFCVPADPKSKDFIGAYHQVYKLLGEAAGTAFGVLDIDGTTEDIATPFKIRAVPTTIFFRDAKEVARVEGNDVELLRKTMANQMPQSAHELEAAVVKKYTIEDPETLSSNSSPLRQTSQHQQQQQDDLRIINAFFGDLGAGNLVDVTDRTRSLLMTGTGTVKADKTELGCTSFQNATGPNNLRVVVDRLGTGKTFTIAEGKTLTKTEINFAFHDHGGLDLGFSDGRSRNSTAEGTDVLKEIHGAANPEGAVQPKACKSK